MSSRPIGIQLPLLTHSTQASIRMIRLFVGPPHSHIKSPSHASELQSESTWKGIPFTHSRHACRHSLFTSHNQHRWKNTNCCVKWKVSKNVRASAKEVDAMKIRACAGFCGLKELIESEAEKFLAMNARGWTWQWTFRFVAGRKFTAIVTHPSESPWYYRFSFRRCASEDSTLDCTEHRLLVPHKARG